MLLGNPALISFNVLKYPLITCIHSLHGWLGQEHRLIYASKMHVGYTVQLKLTTFGLLFMLNVRRKIESKAPVRLKCVRYYNNSLLNVAFPLYDVNQ